MAAKSDSKELVKPLNTEEGPVIELIALLHFKSLFGEHSTWIFNQQRPVG